MLTVYTLKDGGKELRFLKEVIGEADENGIYVSVRGVSNTWDLHFQEETYPLLDALITNLTVTDHADPNRVYLLGFSAGGDGVYQLAPRLADRFAAVNMSLSLASQIPSATSGICTITCQSYNGGTLTGTRTCTVTLNVPSTVVPSISSVTVEDTNTTVVSRIAIGV